MLVPKLYTTLRGYTREQLLADLTAGVIVGIVALPLAIAFAIASGVSPEAGLYTAIIAGFLISALGGSRVQIGGPTGAFVVIVYGIVQRYGVEGLTVATLMAGVILIVMGLARFGGAIKFIPYPVTIGFTSGIALIIFSGEVKDFLGLRMGPVPADFISKWRSFAAHFPSANPWAIGIAVATVLVVFLWPLVSRRVPGAFVALIATTLAVTLFHLPVETIGTRFGHINAGLPRPSLPDMSLPLLKTLIGPAFTIAMLGAIESLLSAVVSDGMIGGRHRSNMELVAQGVANLASPLFGGIPATGAIARTATNVKNGGRTPVAGMTHSVVLLLITLFFGRWAGLVPLATLAGILVVVAYHMSEWHSFVAELAGAPKSDALVLLVTFLLTVLVDLTVAIEVGIVLAAFLFMKRMAEVTNVSVLTHEFKDPAEDFESDPNAVMRRSVPAGVEVYEISGPFFFGAAETFKERVGQVASRPKVLILRMRHVPAIDSTGLHALRELVRRSAHGGSLVLLSDVHAQPVVALERSGLLYDLGEENILGNIDDALNRARAHLGLPPVPRPAFATPTVARETPSPGTLRAIPEP
ncbi:MAG TPA: SulP family inorganic anion transporter [Gemmatimonadales bacterium]|nr:SulP family inorganic anion transporter [Gemmatimonadales bacterium]HZH42419.1 SulP family inorganic anion transporter [Gemmatimonadales bacterium]